MHARVMHQGVRRVDDGGIWDVLDSNVAGVVHHSWSHVLAPFALVFGTQERTGSREGEARPERGTGRVSQSRECVSTLRSSDRCAQRDQGISDLPPSEDHARTGRAGRLRQPLLSAAHNVRQHITGIKHFHHPAVGDLSLTYDRLDLVADPGLTIFTYTAEPGPRNEETLKLLGSWAATLDQTAAEQINKQQT